MIEVPSTFALLNVASQTREQQLEYINNMKL